MLGQFASNELQKGGEFYTPACLVRTMVEILEPYQGRIYDQTTPNMIQDISSIIARKPLIIGEI